MIFTTLQKHKLLLILTLTAFLFASCKQDNTVIIKGDIKGLDTKMVYLSTVYPIKSLPFDSAKVVDGKFEFNIHPDTVIEPDLVTLTYYNKGKRGYIPVTHKQAELIPNNTMVYNSFMLEPGLIELQGDLSKQSGNSMLTAGPQNDFLFKNYNLPYIRISGDSNRRKAQVDRINKRIKEVPNAYYALFAMGNLRYSFDRKTLESFYNNFSDDVKASHKGRQFRQYIDNLPPSKDMFLQSLFVDVNNKLLPVIDSTRKLNIAVFWASWCGPCRQEIPSLKKIYQQISKDDVRFVSISVDDKKADWKTAMDQEKMPWQQLLIQSAEKNRATARYNLGFIPQIYIVDQHNKVVKKIDGFEDGGDQAIIEFINQYLAKS